MADEEVLPDECCAERAGGGSCDGRRPRRESADLQGSAAGAVYFSWTGCYIGGHIGGLWAKKDWTNRDPLLAPLGTSFGSHDADSWLGGVQAGCDYQFAGGFVIGIQGDYAWTDAEGSNVDPFFDRLTSEITRGSSRWRPSPAVSVMPGIVSSAT